MNILAAYYRNKFWIHDFFKGSPIGKHYREIKKLDTLSKESTETYRKKKLENLLKYATRECEFYKGYKDKSLNEFPIVNKTILSQHYTKICVDPSKIPGQKGKLHVQTTSGSTGTPFAIPQDTEKRNRRIAELKYYGKVVGFKTHEMLVHLRTCNKWQNKSPEQIRRERIIPFDIAAMDKKRLGELCETINTNKAICLRGYASSFDLLANYAKENSISFPTVKIIIAGSEALHDDVRANVKKYIGSEIISQYADEECGILAQEKIPTDDKDNVMYFNNASCIFEVLNIDNDMPAKFGELGRIIVTDLHNHAFPLIRYDTGDVGMLLPPDDKSKGFPVLGKLYGRRLDICFTTSGAPFSPMTIGRILKHYDKIIQWQFIQKNEKRYVLKVILKSNVDLDDYLHDAVCAFKETLGDDADIILEQVDGIPTLASGKRKSVINEWKNE